MAHPPTAESPLAIRLLGPIQVEVFGKPMARQRSRKALWLLALLALWRDRDVERGWLAGTLWPESDETRALRNLRQTLHELRAALCEVSSVLSSDSPRTVRFNSAGARIDCADFEQFVSQRDWEAAIRVYGGPLLKGCPEAWVVEPRAQFEAHYLHCLKSHAEGCKPQDAIRFLHAAVSLNPYQEDVRRCMMRAQAESGSPGDAIRTYHELRSLLWREMSTFPEEETTALFEAIQGQGRRDCKPALNHETKPGNTTAKLPTPLTTFIGRQQETVAIRSAIQQSRLLNLIGPGGVGKTRLAMKAAEELTDAFADGAIWISLGPIRDALQIPETVREALDPSSAGERLDPMQVVERHLADRQLLLVLDNCEHLIEPCAAFAERCLAVSKGLRILATSRQPLGLRGEAVYQVSPLAQPPETASSTEVENYDSVRLFMDRATSGMASFSPSLEELAIVGRICRQLDGLPLALELAAARVRSIPVASIHERLQQDMALLRTSDADNPRHASLQRVFLWSWDLLTPEERTVLGRLSVFAGGCSLAAAEAVCSPGNVLEVLSSLVDRSLVTYDPFGEGRYGLLETVRQFAQEQLQNAGDLANTRERHLDYFLAWAEAARPKQRGEEQAIWFTRLERDHDNMRAALAWATEQGERQKELRLALALSRFWDTHGHVREGRARLEAAIARSPEDLPPQLLGDAYGAAGWFALIQGDDVWTERNYGLSLSFYRKAGEELKAAMCLQFLGCIAAKRDYVQGTGLLLDALAIYDKHGRPPVEVLQNLGEASIRHGHFREAREYLAASLACFSADTFAELRCLILCNLAELDYKEGSIEAARAKTTEALTKLLEYGAFIYIPQALDQVALQAFSGGDFERSTMLFGAAEAIGEAYGVDPGELHAAERKAALSHLEGELPTEFPNFRQRGKAMDLKEAADLALMKRA